MSPISGVFQADFSQFSTAVEGAVIKLRDIESGSAKVATSLNTTANSFSGAKVIQQATLMAEVFDRAGGSANFTEKELARMGATGTEAVAKLRALGQDVPPGIQRIADESKNVNTVQTDMLGTVKNLALGFAAMFSARAAVNFVQSVLDDASALKDLSQQSHINVEDLQSLAGAMSEFGVDADTLGKGLFTLSRKIAGGDDSVTHGLALMGLSLKDVEGLQGKELFLKIESGLATLQGSLRDTAAADIFGGKLGAAMAGASEGIEGALDTWQRLNHVASTESVDALDQFGESVARANSNLKAMATNMLGPVAEGFNVLFTAAERGASKWDLVLSLLPKGFAMAGTSGEALNTILDKQNQTLIANAAAAKAAAGGHEANAGSMTKEAQATAFLATLEKNAAGELDATQLQNLAHLKEIGQLNAANALGIGVNSAQFAKYTAGIEAAKKATTDLAAAQKEADAISVATLQSQITNLQAVEAARMKSYGTVEQLAMLGRLDLAEQALAKAVYGEIDSEKERMKIIEAAGARHTAITLAKQGLEEKLTAQISAGIYAELEAQIKLNAARGLDATGGYATEATAADRLKTSLDALAVSTGGVGVSTARTQVAMDQYTKSMFDEAVAGDAAAQAAQKVKDAAAQIPDAAKPAADGLQSIGQAAQQAQSGLFSMTAELYNAIRAAQQADALTNVIPVFGASGQIGTRAAGTRAGGGPVTAGQPYIVGEDRPELFVPSSNGTILPSLGGLVGGGSTVIHNVFHIVDTESNIVRRVSDQITRSVLQGTKLRSA